MGDRDSPFRLNRILAFLDLFLRLVADPKRARMALLHYQGHLGSGPVATQRTVIAPINVDIAIAELPAEGPAPCP